MNRFNSFLLVHKGLRAMLYDASLTLQQTDFSMPAEAEVAVTKVYNVLFAFNRHAHHEDSFVFPMVEKFDPELSAKFEKEHAEDHRLGNCLKNLLTIFENAVLPEEKTICGSAIIKSFTEFLVFNLQHMAKEEHLINQSLWKHYTDEQIIETSHRLVASIPPAEMQNMARWMLRGMSTTDAIGWLKGIKNSTPAFVFNNAMHLAEEELSETRFVIVQEALEEAVLA
ncbi:MAG: hemerythrin domain-containing protein [Parafilimonas sp.]|nr:hemerythrin domain-containing protein [Parafilimonas sp.]